MQLGAFSVSLTVKDLQASREFYAKLGFTPVAGADEQGWLILRNAELVVIGLFQGMFERNMLTFNPGWNQLCEAVEPFTDVRTLQAELERRGLSPVQRATGDSGPGFLTLADPDGNPILIDQHR